MSVSVVVAARDAEATVADAVASALAQTAPPEEVIVCDDGSTDGTVAALAPFGTRVRVLRRPPRGVGAARNAALDAARGEWIAILDADDAMAPSRLEQTAALAAARPELDLLCTDAVFVVDGEETGRFHAATPFPDGDQRTAILERCWLAAPVVRRTALLRAGGFDETLRAAEDWECWMRLVLTGSRAGLVDEPLYRYRLAPGSLTASRERSLRDRVTALERVAPLVGPEQQAAYAASLARYRASALQAEAAAALRDRSPDARARLLAVARSGDVGARARLRAALRAARPGRPA